MLAEFTEYCIAITKRPRISCAHTNAAASTANDTNELVKFVSIPVIQSDTKKELTRTYNKGIRYKTAKKDI